MTLKFRILVAIVLAGCSPVKAGNPGPTPKPYTGLVGQIITGSPDRPTPVAGASVTIDDQKIDTDENGFFDFESVNGQTEKLTIQVNQAQYAPTVRVYPRDKMAGRFVTIHLRPVDVVKQINVGTGGVIVLPGENGAANQAAVRFLPNSINIDAENVDVSLSVIRSHIEAERDAFPGEYVGLSSTPGARGDLLRTMGTVEVSFSVDGRPINGVTLTKPARLQLAMDETVGAEFAEGATIPTWWLDLNSGAWMGEGHATVIRQNNQKIASWEVDHFTWWNLDQSLESHACVAVHLVASDAVSQKELPNLLFHIEGIDYTGDSQNGPFNADGVAVATGWRNHKVKPVLQYIGTENASLMGDLLKATAWEPSLTFALPDTSASSYYNKGPGGIPLDPSKHCRQLTYPFTIRLGTVRGTVIDSFGNPLSGAIVAIPEIGRTSMSGADGSFQFKSVPYREDGSLGVNVSVLPPATRQDLIFDPFALKRDQPDSVLEMVAQVREVSPQFARSVLSNSRPTIGSTIDFGLTVVDNGPALQWGIQHCGKETIMASKVDVASDDKVMICHLPPGNEENVQTISVGEPSLSAHLLHGDTVGACAGIDPQAPPKFEKITADVALAEADCTSELTDLTYTAEQVGTQFNFHLRGKWHGGNTRARQEIRLVAKDNLGYETHHILPVYWRNNTPVIALVAPMYSPIGDFASLDAGASDPDGDTVAVAWRLNGKPAGAGQKIVLGPMVDGANYIEVDASDGFSTVTQRHTLLGVTGGSLSAPDTSLTSTPGSPSASTTATFTFSSPLATATFDCKLDALPFATCVSPLQIQWLTIGTHTFIVRARDAEGRYDATPAFVTWDISLGWKNFSVGTFHSCGVLTRGEMACWGTNAAAELGLGYLSYSSPSPVPVSGAAVGNTWRSVSASDDTNDGVASTCAVQTEGSLWCWGQNLGQFLMPLAGPVTLPTKIGTETDWRSVQLANESACALKTDGGLFCWGNNTYYQLGLGLTTATNQPTPVDAVVAWRSFSLGGFVACAISTDGSLYCWGYGSFGQLGLNVSSLPSPNRVNTEVDWVQVDVGLSHVCAVKANGSVWCWGQNNGQLGISGGAQYQYAPAQVFSSGFRSVSAGYNATCGVRSDNTLWCWGFDDFGQFGDGEYGPVSVPQAPTQISLNTDWMSIELSYYGACGQKLSYDLYCWGFIKGTSLGSGVLYSSSHPALVDDSQGWSKVTSRTAHMCALTQNGDLYCAGKNPVGQIGNGTAATEGFGVQDFSKVLGANIWIDVDVADEGSYFIANNGRTCAIDSTGEMYCWGYQSYDNFGNGVSGSSTTPIVAGNLGGPFTWQTLSLGFWHTCAIDTATRLFCWGRSNFGQAASTATMVSAPREVSGMGWTGWSKVTVNQSDSCGLLGSGTLYCWGINGNFVHGNGAGTGSSTPVSTAIGHTWRDIDLGQYHMCGIEVDRTLWCWGNNQNNQLGQPATSYTQSSIPLAVGVDTDWDRIFTGDFYTCATKTNGTLWCWGFMGGVGIAVSTVSPEQVDSSTDWVSAGSRLTNACGIKSDGSLWCWGAQINGEWGNRGLVRFTPELVPPF